MNPWQCWSPVAGFPNLSQEIHMCLYIHIYIHICLEVKELIKQGSIPGLGFVCGVPWMIGLGIKVSRSFDPAEAQTLTNSPTEESQKVQRSIPFGQVTAAHSPP